MPAFEPSTWAEVEEAIVSNRPSAQTTDTFAVQVRAFTNAPERFITTTGNVSSSDNSTQRDRTGRNNDSAIPADARSADMPSSLESHSRDRDQRRPIAQLKRSEAQFDDLLGHGRVDLDTESFVRRFAAPAHFKELSMFPPSSNRRNSSPINPSSSAFDPAAYLAKIHHDSTVEQLVAGKSVLQQVKHHLDLQADILRSEIFVKAALVENAFESTKLSLASQSPFAHEAPLSLKRRFEQAEAVHKLRYEDIMQREAKLVRLQRTLVVFNRYKWVFTLGARLGSAANKDVSEVEDTVHEYQRAMKWLQAQEGVDLEVVARSIENGFHLLFDALLTRLSNGSLTRHETARLVSVLLSVNREDLLTEVLSKRMATAMEGIQKAVRSVDIAALVIVRGPGQMESDVADLISRTSTAFVDGLAHVWRLGRVLISQDRWIRAVETRLVQLCASYAQVLREHLLSDASLVSAESVRHVVLVRERAASELQILDSCLGPLEDILVDVKDLFLKALASSVRTDAEQAAAQAVRSDTVGKSAAQAIFTIAVDALAQMEATLPRRQETPDRKFHESKEAREGSSKSPSLNGVAPGGGSTSGSEKAVAIIPDSATGVDIDTGAGSSHASSSDSGTNRRNSTAELLATACLEAPIIFLQEVQNRLGRSDDDASGAALKLAVCCADMRQSVIGSIMDLAVEKQAIGSRAARQHARVTLNAVSTVRERALQHYIRLVGGPLRELARALVSFSEDELGDAVRRAAPIRIAGVSKGANEVTLQLALITIATRRKSESREIVTSVAQQLISAIGETLLDALSTHKLAYYRAAQLWVDVSFIQDLVVSGLDTDSDILSSAMEGFARVKERAVQAVVADGFGFSTVDTDMLRDGVLAAAITEAQMVRQCFIETWSFVQPKSNDY